jgi:uncharacterized protein with gpF-like domain
MDRKDYWLRYEKSRLSIEGWARRRILQALSDTVKPILEQVQEEGAQQALSGLEEQTEHIQEAFQDIYAKVGSSFALASYRSLKGQKSEQALDFSWQEYMRAFALTEAGQRIVGITDTTLARIRKVINEGIEQGLGSEEIARNIQRSNAVSRIRARAIARTEVVGASNRGSYLGAKSTGLPLKKIWISTQDDRTRDDHLMADGQEVGLDESFYVGGEEMNEPGDPHGSAFNVINCRCAIAFQRW